MMLGATAIPHYMGSDQSYTVALPLPYLIYRGERFKLDRDGARGLVIDGGRVSLDVGLSAGMPVSGGANRARAGMSALPLTMEAGPRLNIRISKDAAAVERIVRIPVRGVFDVQGRGYGWVLEPRYTARFDSQEDNWKLRLDVGMLVASQRYLETYYGVAPAQATAERATYTSGSGLHSLFAYVTGDLPLGNHLWIKGFTKIRTLAPGVVRDSPLVKRNTNLTVGALLIWLPWQSDERVNSLDLASGK